MRAGRVHGVHAPRQPGQESRSGYLPRRPEETVLYGLVAANLETFLGGQRRRERHVPRFVERELGGLLKCGILAHGFLRVHCDVCGKDRLVAYSCKGRGFCPSCGGRRMAETAAHLVDRVLPGVPGPAVGALVRVAGRTGRQLNAQGFVFLGGNSGSILSVVGEAQAVEEVDMVPLPER